MKGAVALTTVLLIGVMVIAGSVVLVLTSIDLSKSTQVFEYGAKAKNQTRTCVEEAMYRLRRDPLFTGEISYSNTDYFCSGVVSNIAGEPSKKALSVTGTVTNEDLYASSSDYVIDISTEPYEISRI